MFLINSSRPVPAVPHRARASVQRHRPAPARPSDRRDRRLTEAAEKGDTADEKGGSTCAGSAQCCRNLQVQKTHQTSCVCKVQMYWEASRATVSSAGLRHSSVGCRQQLSPQQAKDKIKIKKANRSERFPGAGGGPEAGWCRADNGRPWPTMAERGISRWRCNIQVAIPVTSVGGSQR